MKKLLAIILSAALLIGVSACAEAPRSDSEEENEITEDEELYENENASEENEDEASESEADLKDEEASEEEDGLDLEDDFADFEEDEFSENENDFALSENPPPPAESDYIGNGARNIANSGMATADGDYIYYVGFEKDDYGYYTDAYEFPPVLFKCKTDGSEKAKLYECGPNGVFFLTVYNDRVYFYEARNNDQGEYITYIASIKTDGSDFKILANVEISENGIYIYNDEIYYGDLNDDLYKIGIDGSEEIPLDIWDSESVYDYAFYEDWVYYNGSEGLGEWDGWGVHKIRLDGSEKQLLYKGDGYNFIITEDWIYFTDFDALGEYNAFAKMRHDGSEYETDLTVEFPFGNINICGSWGYFANFGEGLYKFSLDEPDQIYLISNDKDAYFNVLVANGWIYFAVDYSEDFESAYVYRISIDGLIEEI